MRVEKLTKTDITMRLALILLTILSVILAAQIVSAQEDEKKPLNFSVVEKALRSTKTTAAAKNALLIEGVNTRKITFWLTAENEKKLRAWGANAALIEAVRQNQQPMYPMIQKDLKMDKPIEVKNSIGIEFVLIPTGEFAMGLGKNEKDARVYDGTFPHNVKIKREFYLGKFEVTQAQWKLLMGKNPSNFQDCGTECPVENISWNDAQAFIKKLNEKNDGYHYRLPSEAEWEYAARATTETKYYWGDDPDRKNWQYYAHYSQFLPAKIGSYLPNAFGLYDMSGNVWEMCEDVWRRDFKNVNDDSAPNTEGDAERRVVKGGGWGQSFDELRTSRRNDISLDDPNYGRGFRLLATPIDAAIEPKTIVDDNLNSKTISPLEIASSIKGEVKVEVFIDENGKVQTVKFDFRTSFVKGKSRRAGKRRKVQRNES